MKKIEGYILCGEIFLLLLQGCTASTPQEIWRITKLITLGEESTNTFTQATIVRNCGAPEHKTIDCSAGTTNDVTFSLGGGAEFGEGIKGNVNAGFGTSLGVGRNGGQSLILDEPPQNSIYQYQIEEIYWVKSGQAKAVSSSGKELIANFTYYASCSMQIKSRELLPCSTLTPDSTTTLPPTPTLETEATLPAKSAKGPDIYDDFKDPQYNGTYNNNLWVYSKESSDTFQVVQRDGMLVLSDTGETKGQGVTLRMQDWAQDAFGFFEAKVKVHYQDGVNGNISLNAGSPTIPEGWTEMGISPMAYAAFLHINVGKKGLLQSKVENDKWYVLRLTYNPSNNSIAYSLDGYQIASYFLPEKPSTLKPSIQMWHPAVGGAVAYIDYVKIGP